jgi:hypothetical protein
MSGPGPWDGFLRLEEARDQGCLPEEPRWRPEDPDKARWVPQGYIGPVYVWDAGCWQYEGLLTEWENRPGDGPEPVVWSYGERLPKAEPWRLCRAAPGNPTSWCEECKAPQFMSPHGSTCENGHGGAPGRDTPPIECPVLQCAACGAKFRGKPGETYPAGVLCPAERAQKKSIVGVAHVTGETVLVWPEDLA